MYYYNPEDYIGLRFGRLTVIKVKRLLSEGKKVYYRYIAICKCDCGNEIELDLIKLLKKKYKNIDELECQKCKSAKAKYNNPLYNVLHDMKTRCYNPNYDKYAYYGGKGIKICDEWLKSFPAFESWALSLGWNKDLTIDRIDNNKDYCPENCRLATRKQQVQTRGIFKNNTSGYKGIWYYKKMSKWQAKVGRVYLGCYKTQKEALDIINKYIIDNGLDYPIQEYKGEIGSVNKQ